MQVAQDKVVAIDFTLKDDAGQVLDTSEGEGPLHYLHGAGNIIPGLENALEGKSIGDIVQVTVPPADAYGERYEQLQEKVSRSEFEDVNDLQIGMQFQISGDDEEENADAILTVIDLDEETVTLDGNHPLAGETLHFDVTVREIRDANAEELEHGHVHGPDGHEH